MLTAGLCSVRVHHQRSVYIAHTHSFLCVTIHCCPCVPCRPTVEPTNLLKTLAEQDTNFEAYLKLAQHQDHPNETESQVKHG
jgi:hypothetical protein